MLNAFFADKFSKVERFWSSGRLAGQPPQLNGKQQQQQLQQAQHLQKQPAESSPPGRVPLYTKV
jgi:hypothetical protein